jgi:hypothetical protein
MLSFCVPNAKHNGGVIWRGFLRFFAKTATHYGIRWCALL